MIKSIYIYTYIPPVHLAHLNVTKVKEITTV